MFLGSPNGRDGPDSSQDPQLPKTRRLREVPNNERSFLSSFFFLRFFFDVDDFIIFLEEEMATHSSILAWKIPWTEEPGLGYS